MVLAAQSQPHGVPSIHRDKTRLHARRESNKNAAILHECGRGMVGMSAATLAWVEV
jgi:hypothetical protein